jgi:hypothetical protein
MTIPELEKEKKDKEELEKNGASVDVMGAPVSATTSLDTLTSAPMNSPLEQAALPVQPLITTPGLSPAEGALPARTSIDALTTPQTIASPVSEAFTPVQPKIDSGLPSPDGASPLTGTDTTADTIDNLLRARSRIQPTISTPGEASSIESLITTPQQPPVPEGFTVTQLAETPPTEALLPSAAPLTKPLEDLSPQPQVSLEAAAAPSVTAEVQAPVQPQAVVVEAAPAPIPSEPKTEVAAIKDEVAEQVGVVTEAIIPAALEEPEPPVTASSLLGKPEAVRRLEAAEQTPPVIEELPVKAVEHTGETVRVAIQPGAENHMEEVGEQAIADQAHVDLQAAHPEAGVTGATTSHDGIDGSNIIIGSSAWGDKPLKTLVPFTGAGHKDAVNISSFRQAQKEAHSQSDTAPNPVERIAASISNFMKLFNRKNTSDTPVVSQAA